MAGADRNAWGLVGLTLLLAPLLAPSSASAADILFVSDYTSDLAIATALTSDGHTVTTITNDFTGTTNTRLAMPLDAFDAVFWSAQGRGHTDPALFTNLTSYVSAGGRVFVTGFDAILSDPLLVAFVGGTSSSDVFVNPGPVVMLETSLTVGVVDIRGVSPTGSSDNDCLRGLGSDTILIAANGADTACAQWTLRTLGSGEVAWVASGSSTVWTAVAGAYNGAMRNFASAAAFGMSDPGAPVIDLVAPFGNEEGAEIAVTVMLEDLEGDPYTWSWDLDDDGTFGERAGEAAYTIAAGTTDGPSSARVGVQAIDSHGNTAVRYRTLRVTNVAPRVSSTPPSSTSVGVDLAYRVEVDDPAGPLDPPRFMLVTGPPRMSVNDAGLVSWIPNESDVTLAGETHLVVIGIDDGDEGTSEHRFELMVSPNHRPSTPVPSFPTDMIAILDRTPRLVTQNSEDADLDRLTYTFELDTVDSFDSPDFLTSGALDEVPGFTQWQLTAPLRENQIYHWRVKSNDGTIDSEWRQTVFYVVRDPALGPPDAGRPDAGSFGDGGLIPGIDGGPGTGGGGCSAAPVRSRDRSAPVWLAFFAIALVLRRRRV